MLTFKLYCYLTVIIFLPVLIECKMRKDDIKSNIRTYMYLKQSAPIVIRNTTANSSEFDSFKQMFNPNVPTKIVIHGWMSNVNRTYIHGLITAYRQTTDYNILAIDWKPITFQLYTTTIKYLVNVGDYVGELINFLIDDLHTSPGLIHIVGYSLGAHVAGIASSRVNNSQKISRITGLDPASPGVTTSECLDKRHADFVDVVHTSGGFLAMMDNIGHADFYPNNGKANQPGCYFPPNCSHRRAIAYYTESILNRENTFMSHVCDSWENYQEGLCFNTTAIQMGEHTDLNALGKYYLRTKPKSPFSMK